MISKQTWLKIDFPTNRLIKYFPKKTYTHKHTQTQPHTHSITLEIK